MKVSNIPITEEGRPYLKMKALREATGLPASTIQYYQSLGLLQETVKTGANMAYYHPDTIERIRLIRLLKSRYRLSMAKIKEMIDSNAMDDDVKVIASLNELIFGPETEDMLDKARFSKATGLKPAVIRQLVDMGLLVPMQKGLFDPQDVMIGIILNRALSYQIEPKDIEFYAKSAKALAEEEMLVRRRVSENTSVSENSEVTLELTQMARAFRSYVFDRTFQKRILSIIEVSDE